MNDFDIRDASTSGSSAFLTETNSSLSRMTFARSSSNWISSISIPTGLSIISQAKDLPGIKYIRVGRKESYPVYEEGTEFKVGKGNVVREGKDAVIIASGIMVN